MLITFKLFFRSLEGYLQLMNSLSSNQLTFTSTVDETSSKNEDAMKEVMKDGENEKTEEEQAKSTNEVGRKMLMQQYY